MTARRRFGLLIFGVASAFAALAFACSAPGIGEAPTATPLPTSPPQPTLPPPTQPPEPTLPPPPTEAPAPQVGTGQLDIVSVKGYMDRYDVLHIVGIVQNNTGAPASDIDVQVEVFDSDGDSIHQETTYTDLYTVIPGQETTFALSVFEELEDAARFEATVVGSSVATLDAAPVEARNIVVTIDDNGDVHITGELVPTGGGAATVNGVAGAIFDDAGNLVTAGGSSVAMGYVTPDSPGPFRITMSGPAAGVPPGGTWTVYMDAERATETPTLGFSLSEVYDYRDGFNSLHVVGEVTNDNDTAVTIRLVAAVYDAAGNVIDASSTDTPFFTISPGETVPYDLDSWDAINATASLVGARVTVQVDHAWTWSKDDNTVVLSTDEDANSFDESGGTFTGQIVNNTQSTVTGATIVVAFHDKTTGQIRGTGFDWVFEEMSPEDSEDYEVFIPISPGFDVSSASAVWYVKGDLP